MQKLRNNERTAAEQILYFFASLKALKRMTMFVKCQRTYGYVFNGMFVIFGVFQYFGI